MASTFLSAPPYCTPTTSLEVYERNVSVCSAFWQRRATLSQGAAMVTTVGMRWASSLAKLGPESTAMRSVSAPVISAMTSLIRRPVSTSMPFIRLTRIASSAMSGIHAPRLARSDCAGTARTTTSAPASTSAGSAVAVIAMLLVVALSALLKLTRFGLNARAVIMNERLARGLGIDSTRVRALTFGLGAALACAAGALITPLISVDPNMGLPWLVNSFMLVMVAGVSFPGLLAASLILGGAQVVVSTYASPILGGMTIVVAAALVLRISPKGFSRA